MPKATEGPSPVALPDWGAFQVGMLTNQAYQRVSNSSADQLSVNRLETFFSIQGEELPVAAQLWGLMIHGVPDGAKPNAADAAAWNAIARATHMPITFDDNGLLQAVTNDG